MKQGYLKKTGILCLAIVFLMAAGCGKAKTQEAEENAFNIRGGSNRLGGRGTGR